jgi:hypothetical protein
MLHIINFAKSIDGVTWKNKGQAIPSKIGYAQAFSRPTVYEDNDLNLHMWFSYRSGGGSSYRIGYAIKKYKTEKWGLILKQNNIQISSKGWDSQMIAYPCVFKHKENVFMLYNGNDYGKTGIGLAMTSDIS